LGKPDMKYKIQVIGNYFFRNHRMIEEECVSSK